MEDFVTVKEVSIELGLSTYTVREMLRNDEMPGYRFGREWRIERAKYEEWKRQRRKPNRYSPSQES